MNLLNDPWIPVLLESGQCSRIAPWQITQTGDRVLAIKSPRPDFDAALIQFLIGLLQTAMPPQTSQEWIKRISNRPKPEELKKSFQEYCKVFEAKTFMQDFDPLDTEPVDISQLVMDSPVENTIRKNADHFVKRGRIEGLCPSCVITALFTLQTNASGGGLGYRTSVRGGGPLSTLATVDGKSADTPEDLWTNVWINVLCKDWNNQQNDNNSQSDIFPWLAKTRTSERGSPTPVTTPEDVNHLQVFWGMPCRIRIQWDNAQEGRCDLCHENSSNIVSQYKTKNYGVNYGGAWSHPLTPYYMKNGERLPEHLHPRGLTYAHWPDLVLPSDNNNKHRAKTIERWAEMAGNGFQFRLRAFGYDMKQANARCWYESNYPLFQVGNPQNFQRDVRNMVDSSVRCANMLAKAVKDATKTKRDMALLKAIFHSNTEEDFFRSIGDIAKIQEQDQNIDEEREQIEEIKSKWKELLAQRAINLFDEWTPLDDNFNQGNIAKIVKAKKKLCNFLRKM